MQLDEHHKVVWRHFWCIQDCNKKRIQNTKKFFSQKSFPPKIHWGWSSEIWTRSTALIIVKKSREKKKDHQWMLIRKHDHFYGWKKSLWEKYFFSKWSSITKSCISRKNVCSIRLCTKNLEKTIIYGRDVKLSEQQQTIIFHRWSNDLISMPTLPIMFDFEFEFSYQSKFEIQNRIREKAILSKRLLFRFSSSSSTLKNLHHHFFYFHSYLVQKLSTWPHQHRK